MAAAPKSWVDHFRTIVWIDNLTNQLGLTHTALDRLYFEKYISFPSEPGSPAGEADRRFARYAAGRIVPRPDPVLTPTLVGGARILKLDPLRAMEREAPGSARWFFHPLFNLMDGRIQSSEAMLKWLKRCNPEDELFQELFIMLGRESRSGGRRKEPDFDLPQCILSRSEEAKFSLRMVREEILRLDEGLVDVLFQKKEGQFYRWPSPVVDEVNHLLKEITVGRLSAAIGLFIEAELLGAVDRIEPIAELIAHQLPSLDKEKPFSRVSKKLARLIHMSFGSYSLPGYTRRDAEMNGFPASWR